MAVDSLITATSAISAYSSQAQGNDAQRNRLNVEPRRESASEPRLSVFGQVRASLEEVQAKAEALRNFNNSPTLSDFKVAVQGFVQSFNSLNRSVADAAAKGAARQEARSEAQRAEQARAAQVQSELRRAEQNTAGAVQSLRNFGVERQESGSLNVNATRLQNSFDNDPQGTVSAFAEVADRVSRAIDKQLSSIGNIGSNVNDLSSRQSDSASVSEESRAQARLEVQKNYQQRLASQLAGAGSYAARNAVVTYLSVSDF